jgi:hypothetical protein
MQLHVPLLSLQVNAASWHTQELHTLPCYMTFTLKCQGNKCPKAPTAPRVIEGTNQQAQFPWKQHHRTALPEVHSGNQAPGLLLPEGLVPPCLQCYFTILLEPTPGKQAADLPLPEGLVLPHLQQLQWLQIAQYHQAGFRVCTA